MKQPAIRLPRLKVPLLALVFAAAITSCSGPDGARPADQPLTTATRTAPATPTTEGTATMTSSPATNGAAISIDINGQPVRGVLDSNTTARALLDQLPLTLTFKDFGGQEKIADLPAPLSIEGMPAASDAPPLTIGYYAPDQALVLYYEYVGRYKGIVPIGRFEDLAAVRDQGDSFTATLSRR